MGWWLVASTYLSEYELDVRHTPGENNFIPPSVSRLTAPETDLNEQRLWLEYAALDDVLGAVETLMAKGSRDGFQAG